MPVNITRSDYERALERGRRALDRPHVTVARYNASDRLMELQYSSGWVLRFDPMEIDALKAIPEQALAEAYVTPGGDALLFDNANASVSIAALVAQLIPLDVARTVVASARGKVTSEAKAEAARLNGLKGGRPRKTIV